MSSQLTLGLSNRDRTILGLIQRNAAPEALQTLSYYLGELCAVGAWDLLRQVLLRLYDAASGSNISASGAFSSMIWILEGYFMKLPQDPRVTAIVGEIRRYKKRTIWKDVLELIGGGEASAAAIVERIGLSRVTGNDHRRTMMKRGLIELVPGRKLGNAAYRLTALGRAVLDALTGTMTSKPLVRLRLRLDPVANHASVKAAILGIGADLDMSAVHDGETIPVQVPVDESAAMTARLSALPGVAGIDRS